MKKYKKIAKTAVVKNSKIESRNITIKKNVKLTNVQIKAKKLIIEPDSTLLDCKIFSEGEVTIGKNCVIKEDTIINAFRGITIGSRCIIDRNVFVGGMQSEHSEIQIGDDCAILYRAYLNTTKKILLGNNVGVGGYSLIFTHSAWQNVLNGSPNKFGDVIVGDNVWIPWNVVILPGIKIGKNALIGTGSVVTKDVLQNVFVTGNPAKIKRGNKKKIPTKNEKNHLVLKILDDFHNYAQDFLKLPNKIKTINSTGDDNSVRKKGIKKYTAISFNNSELFYAPTIDTIPKNNVSIIISFKIPQKLKLLKKYQWIELDTLDANLTNDVGKSFASFIRRYGIRLKI